MDMAYFVIALMLLGIGLTLHSSFMLIDNEQKGKHYILIVVGIIMVITSIWLVFDITKGDFYW